MNTSDLIEEILNGLVATWDEAGTFGEPPTKVGFHITGKPEAVKALLTLISESNVEARKKLVAELFPDYETATNPDYTLITNVKTVYDQLTSGEKTDGDSK